LKKIQEMKWIDGNTKLRQGIAELLDAPPRHFHTYVVVAASIAGYYLLCTRKYQALSPF
jgi:hypothetical protein